MLLLVRRSVNLALITTFVAISEPMPLLDSTIVGP
jgi:hypothetical protein